MQARQGAFRGILEEVAWEYGTGSPSDVWQLLERERRRVELERLAHSELPDLPEPISECIDTFLEIEFDLKRTGLRGLGRMSDEIPRLAARHRPRFRIHSARQREQLREHARNHMLCGYLFARFRVEPDKPRPELPAAADLFQRWIPLIYSPAGAERIGVVLGVDSEEDQILWCSATERALTRMLQSLGIEPDQLDQVILLHYFSAGILLALLELGKVDPSADDDDLQTIENELEASVPAELFQYGNRPVGKVYVALNGVLMAWVMLFYLGQFLKLGPLA